MIVFLGIILNSFRSFFFRLSSWVGVPAKLSHLQIMVILQSLVQFLYFLFFFFLIILASTIRKVLNNRIIDILILCLSLMGMLLDFFHQAGWWLMIWDRHISHVRVISIYSYFIKHSLKKQMDIEFYLMCLQCPRRWYYFSLFFIVIRYINKSHWCLLGVVVIQSGILRSLHVATHLVLTQSRTQYY